MGNQQMIGFNVRSFKDCNEILFNAYKDVIHLCIAMKRFIELNDLRIGLADELACLGVFNEQSVI